MYGREGLHFTHYPSTPCGVLFLLTQTTDPYLNALLYVLGRRARDTNTLGPLAGRMEKVRTRLPPVESSRWTRDLFQRPEQAAPSFPSERHRVDRLFEGLTFMASYGLLASEVRATVSTLQAALLHQSLLNQMCHLTLSCVCLMFKSHVQPNRVVQTEVVFLLRSSISYVSRSGPADARSPAAG